MMAQPGGWAWVKEKLLAPAESAFNHVGNLAAKGEADTDGYDRPQDGKGDGHVLENLLQHVLYACNEGTGV
jgi:hypothetical protein